MHSTRPLHAPRRTASVDTDGSGRANKVRIYTPTAVTPYNHTAGMQQTHTHTHTQLQAGMQLTHSRHTANTAASRDGTIGTAILATLALAIAFVDTEAHDTAQ